MTNSGELEFIYGPDTQATIDSLQITFVDYDQAEIASKDKIEQLTKQIQALETQKNYLSKIVSRTKDTQSMLIHEYSDQLVSQVKDPHSSIHPVYKAVIQAAVMENGSLWYQDHFFPADKLGKDLSILDKDLVTKEDSVPILEMKRNGRYKDNQPTELLINFAMSQSEKGLTPMLGKKLASVCGCGAEHYQLLPSLVMPTTPESTVSIEPDMKRPLYRRSDGHVIAYRDYSRIDTILNKIDIVKKQPAIHLPTGGFNRETYELGIYDVGKEMTTIDGPTEFLSDERSFFAIGEKSVKKILEDYRDVAAESFNNPFIHYDVADFAASSLGITLKSRKNLKDIKKLPKKSFFRD